MLCNQFKNFPFAIYKHKAEVIFLELGIQSDLLIDPSNEMLTKIRRLTKFLILFILKIEFTFTINH